MNVEVYGTVVVLGVVEGSSAFDIKGFIFVVKELFECSAVGCVVLVVL